LEKTIPSGIAKNFFWLKTLYFMGFSTLNGPAKKRPDGYGTARAFPF
jgi:hypothetical protein